METLWLRKNFDTKLQKLMHEKKEKMNALLWNIKWQDFISQNTVDILNNYFSSIGKDIQFCIKEFSLDDWERNIWSYEAIICINKWKHENNKIFWKDHLTSYF